MPLKVSDGIAAWIKDFKKSDAPQFKGKDEKERRDQAIAAYLSAKRGDQNEDVDEKTVGYKSDSKLPNLKVPIKRRQGKILNRKTGKFEEVDEAKKPVKEEATFKVNIEGLPMMFISGMGSGDVKAKLRAIVKQPSMIQSVKRVTDVEVKKNFRLKAQGRDEEDQVDESSYDKINKYHDAANKSKDRATNSAVATILRKGDHSKDLNTMRKREKGIKLAKSRVTDKIRKGQKS